MSDTRTEPAVVTTAPSRRDDGFTLTQLAIVIVIIGLLTAIAIPVWLNWKKRAVDTSLKAEIHSLVVAQETWASQNPGQAGTTDLAALRAAGWVHKDPSTRVWVYVKYGVGYYIMARNDADSNNGAGGYGVLYDSTLGGYLSGGKNVSWTPYGNLGAVPDPTTGGYSSPTVGTSAMCGNPGNPCP